jgi:hypothetical protein
MKFLAKDERSGFHRGKANLTGAMNSINPINATNAMNPTIEPDDF